MLKDVDIIIFDIQDVGARFFTYASTMSYGMEAAKENKKSFYVLDRPNPINGSLVQGPVLDKGSESFVGFHPVAVRHGMTAGETAHSCRGSMGHDIRTRTLYKTLEQRIQQRTAGYREQDKKS